MRNKTSKSSRSGSWLITAALVIGSSAYLLLGFMPAMRALAESRQKTAERRDYVSQADRLKPAVENATLELEKTRAYNQRSAEKLSDDRKLAELYQQITTQAKLAGVVSKRFEPQKRTSPYQTLRQSGLTIEAVGSFSQLCAMLAAFESLPVTMNFESIKVMPQRQDGLKSVCELKLAIFLACSEKND